MNDLIRKSLIVGPALYIGYLVYACPCATFLECSKTKIGASLGLIALILILPP